MFTLCTLINVYYYTDICTNKLCKINIKITPLFLVVAIKLDVDVGWALSVWFYIRGLEL